MSLFHYVRHFNEWKQKNTLKLPRISPGLVMAALLLICTLWKEKTTINLPSVQHTLQLTKQEIRVSAYH